MDPATHDEWIRKQRTILVVVGLLFGVLFLRLFHIQISSAADYTRESEDNRIQHKRIKAPRGLILDSEANILAGNRASYTIFLTRSTAKRDAQAVAALEEVIGSSIKYSSNGRSPRVRLKRDIAFKTVCVVEERLRDEWNLDIEIEPQRNYPYGPLVAHLLGYMGEMQESDLSAPHAKRYETGDYIGKTGIEKVYEDSLRGDDGVRYIEVDALRRIKNDFPYPERDQNPSNGHDLVLTVDLAVQQAAKSALPDTLAGSVVALDARTGAVLAMVSKPSFDPNVFVSFQAQEERQRLLQGDVGEPMLNRSTGGTYPPGSTLKLVAAVAALEGGITDTLSTFEACAGSLAVGDVVFRCANRKEHGELNLLEAVEVSCNIYFNNLAKILGMEAWRQSAEDFGFGQHTGIRLDPGEKTGLLPTKKNYDVWVGGHLMNLVIGQGKMLVTPLQMARYTAALGNGGHLVTPHVSGTPPPTEKIDVSPVALDIVKKAMHRVVQGEKGTGWRVRIPGVELGGKSGTAQVPNRPDDDAWFIAFAPYQEPEIAVAVVIEAGGPGGARAGPVARRVIEAYLESTGYFSEGPTAALQVPQ